MRKKGRKLQYALIAAAIVFGGLMLVQLFYPTTNLPIGTTVAGINLSGREKNSAIRALNLAYNDANIDVYLADSDDIFMIAKPQEFGLEIDNTKRINAMSYPWYMRIVPTSLLWWGLIAPDNKPSTTFNDSALKKFVENGFGSPCRVEPRNAMLTIDDGSINIANSHIGGTCHQYSVRDNFRDVEFVSASAGIVKIDLAVEYPEVETESAAQLAKEISLNLLDDLELEFEEANDTVTLGHDELVSWIDFEVIDGKLTPVLNEQMSSEFYKTKVAPLVERNAGITTIIASEMTEAVRVNGVRGRVINTVETNLRIVEYLLNRRQTVAVAVESTDPSINYVYSRAEASSVENGNETPEEIPANNYPEPDSQAS